MTTPFDVTGIEIRTERLILRAWRESDLEDFYEYARVDGVGQRAGWLPHENIEKSRKILDGFIQNRDVFAIVFGEKAIGSLGVHDKSLPVSEFDELKGREIGFVLSKDYWNKGIMTEAVKAITEYLFRTLDWDYLLCGHYDFNVQSKRVQEKCGFKPYRRLTFDTRMGTKEKGILNLLWNPYKPTPNVRFSHPETLIYGQDDTNFQDQRGRKMFRNDYSELGAKEVLEALIRCQNEQNVGYGLDTHSENAAKLIRATFGLKENEADVHFLSGGTQSNVAVLSYFLRPYEAVIACDTGHINVHETGAIEASGHKVLAKKNADGKLRAEDVLDELALHTDEHTVKPRMVYISDSTETGTVYTKKDLAALRKVCDENDLLLFMDGARLGVALTSEDNDMTPEDIGRFCDIFYVGGTKNGALYGEAVVIKAGLANDFRFHIKNRCAMLAKGFALGIQFETLFTNGLYWELAKTSNRTASYIRSGLDGIGIKTVGGAKSNQIFIEVPADKADALTENFGLELWTDLQKTKILRIVTSFATTIPACDQLLDALKEI